MTSSHTIHLTNSYGRYKPGCGNVSSKETKEEPSVPLVSVVVKSFLTTVRNPQSDIRNPKKWNRK
ncbi:MAG TPA: hypothetical protein VGQ81_13605 [Acidobacteriota bacterium]|nr:hypothetical protein [Acidobacteriota bacterium]